ncbi:hypothetical protein EAG08_02595 [Chryseobacterium sp. 3008163]|nr:hypothetical protein EAG08_02595 [Chryseobacterium sp. 3008163]
MKFSQRIGKSIIIKDIQIESIDNDLKNGLWNIYDLYLLGRISEEYDYYHNVIPSVFFSNSLWHNLFKYPIDQIPSYFPDVKTSIRIFFSILIGINFMT